MLEENGEERKKTEATEVTTERQIFTDQKAEDLKNYLIATSTSARRLAVKGIELGVCITRKWISATIKYGKNAVDQYKKRIDEQRLNNFMLCEQSIRKYSDVVSDNAIKQLDDFAKASSLDSKARQKFVENDLVKKLLIRAQRRENFVNDDVDFNNKRTVFTALSGDFLELVPRQLVDSRLSGVKKKYLWSNSGNVAASVIFGARGNGAGQAAALANSARVGHHNGKVKSAFSEGIASITYSVNMHDIPEIQSELLRFAKRVLFFNCDQDDIAAKAYFCLVYNNGKARVAPPDFGEFSTLLDPEFHNTFRDQLWSVADCFTRLKGLSVESDLLKRLSAEKNSRPLMKFFIDELPSYPI